MAIKCHLSWLPNGTNWLHKISVTQKVWSNVETKPKELRLWYLGVARLFATGNIKVEKSRWKCNNISPLAPCLWRCCHAKVHDNLAQNLLRKLVGYLLHLFCIVIYKKQILNLKKKISTCERVFRHSSFLKGYWLCVYRSLHVVNKHKEWSMLYSCIRQYVTHNKFCVTELMLQNHTRGNTLDWTTVFAVINAPSLINAPQKIFKNVELSN